MTCEELGAEWRLYYNSGSFKSTLADYTSPTWVEFDDAQDVTLAAPKDVIEMLRRGGTVKEVITQWAEFSISFDMHYRNTTVLNALDAHYWNADPCDWMHIAIMNGPIATSGSKGFQMPAMCVDWGVGAPIAGRTNVPLVFRPTYQLSETTYKAFEQLTVA